MALYRLRGRGPTTAELYHGTGKPLMWQLDVYDPIRERELVFRFRSSTAAMGFLRRCRGLEVTVRDPEGGETVIF